MAVVKDGKRVVRTLFPFLLLCGCLAAQSSLETAVTLAREGRYAEAQKAIEGASEPSDLKQRIAYHRLKAAIASGLGKASSAVEEMRSALRLSPGDPALLLSTAMAEAQAGSLDDALDHARSSEESATEEALVGDIEERRGDFVASVEAYRKAISLAPEYERYRIALGLELIQHQAFSSAIEVLTPAASHFPKSGKIRTLLGIAHYAYGDSREAVITLEDAITVEPQLDAAYDCLAQVVLQSSAAAPERSFELLCGWNQVVCAALKLRVGHESGDVAAQEAAIAELERSANNDAIGQCELARGLEWTNELEKARKQMERCVSLDPSAQNHYRLALVYQRLGLTDLARKELDSRKQLLQNMSEQTALGLSALRGLGQTMQPAPAIH